MKTVSEINLKNVNTAFTKQSIIFDRIEEENIILKLMRKKIRDHVLSSLNPGDKILELNAGTGLDAVFFAQKGFEIHAIDVSDGMIKELEKKVFLNNLKNKISYEKLSFSNLEQIKNKKFDFIFSNFGGLNCIDDLRKVTKNFPSLLNKNGRVTLIVMPKICPWEIALSFKGNFKTAFRRFKKNGTLSNIEGIKFKSYYHSPKKIIASLGKDFKLINLIGLNSLIPPPYMKNFPKYFPGLFRFLEKIENKISHRFPFNIAADHFILTAKYEPE